MGEAGGEVGQEPSPSDLSFNPISIASSQEIDGEPAGEVVYPLHSMISSTLASSIMMFEFPNNNSLSLNRISLPSRMFIPTSTSAVPSKKPTMPSTLRLMALPRELHLSIIDQLESFPSSMTLRLVNTYFYNLVKPLSYPEMLTAEKSDYALFHGIVACYKCQRLRPGHKFNEYQRHVCVPGCRHREKRICIECNLQAFYDNSGKGHEVSTGEWESC